MEDSNLDYLFDNLLIEDCKLTLSSPYAKLCDYLFDLNNIYNQLKDQIDNDEIFIYGVDYLEFLICNRIEIIEINEENLKEYARATNWDYSYESLQISKYSSVRVSEGLGKGFNEIFLSENDAKLVPNEHYIIEYSYFCDSFKFEIAKFFQLKYLKELQPIAEAHLLNSKPPFASLSNMAMDKQSESIVTTLINRYKNENNWLEGHKKLLISTLYERKLFKKLNPTNDNKLAVSYVTKILSEEFDLEMSNSTIKKNPSRSITRNGVLEELLQKYNKAIDELQSLDNQDHNSELLK